MEKCAGGDGCQNEYAGEQAATESFSRAVFLGLNALSIADKNFGGAENADELGGQEVVDEPLPARAVMEKSPLADSALDFFRWRGQ